MFSPNQRQHFLKTETRDFPHSSVVKTPRFQAWGCGSHMVQPEKKKKKDRDGALVTEHPARARCAMKVQKVKFLA